MSTKVVPDINSNVNGSFSPKDLVSDQDIKWCPGCGDYSILKQVQQVIPTLGIPREKIVFVSGIGCSSRFPYYMETFGMHSIHGRGPAVATGLKISNPELSVWLVTGDGDALSIGGNHFMHTLRRNIDMNILLFNNEIYGLTKGQYSPTSESGKVTKSTPFGSVDDPVNPVAISLASDASFVARTMDRDPKHIQYVLNRAANHKGTSLIEIYQNCNVFNDGAFFVFTDKETKPATTLFLEDGQPLIFGPEKEFGIRLVDNRPEVVDLKNGGFASTDLWIHDESDLFKAQVLSRFFDDPRQENALPRPFGVIFRKERPVYEDKLSRQLTLAREKSGEPDLDKLIRGNSTWKA